MFVNPGYGKRVVLGRLEDPFFDRVGDFYPGCTGDQGDLRLLHQGDDRHRISGRAGTDNRNDFVFFDESCGNLNGLGGIPLGIVDHKLQLATPDSSNSVYLVNDHLSGVPLWFAEK